MRAAPARRAWCLSPDSTRGTARDAILQARSLKPDVILLDVVMPDQSGLDVIPTLLHEQPETKILVLSMQDDPQYVRQAFAAGASGYVLKEAADTEVVAAIREVAKGGRYVDPELGARLVVAETEAVTRTRRSRSSSTSRCARPRRTGGTSCGSSASRAAPSSCATLSRRACSRASAS